MKKTLIDLHLHSDKSDGKQSPVQVVLNLYHSGISFGVLADHDSIAGTNEFIIETSKLGIGTITGVEVSAYEYGAGIHILGYGIDNKSKQLLNFFKSQALERKVVFDKYIDLFKKAGFTIDQKLYRRSKNAPSVTKTHVFELIWAVSKNHELALKYGLKENKKEPFPFNFQSPFINLFMTFPGQIAYAKKKQVSAKEVISLIHLIGGIAVWAHPGLEMEFVKDPNFFMKVFKNLLSYGLDGLEVYSTASSHTKKWMAHLHELAIKHKLLSTIGTDDHNGKSMGTLKVPEKIQKEILNNLLARIKVDRRSLK